MNERTAEAAYEVLAEEVRRLKQRLDRLERHTHPATPPYRPEGQDGDPFYDALAHSEDSVVPDEA